MTKKIIIGICCSCLLKAGWYEDTKAKANALYERSKEKTSSAYESTSSSIQNKVEGVKESYKNYSKEKTEEEQLKRDACVNNFKERIPAYGLFLEKYYMNVNNRVERKIINSYKKLRDEDISIKLQKKLDPILLKKLQDSQSLLEFSSSSISALKNIQIELKKNDSKNLDSLIKQVQFLMFTWTTPMEIMSTDNLYNNSLLGMSDNLYKNSLKKNYKNYAQFIYSLLYVNLVNENTIIKKDTVLSGGLKAFYGLGSITISNDNKKGIETICKDLMDRTITVEANKIVEKKFASMFNIKEEELSKEIEQIMKKNNIFTKPKMFTPSIKDLEEISIVENPLTDNWYFMIREYMALQDDFYNMKKEIEKIIKILKILPNSEKQMAKIKQNLFEVDALYRKYDEVVRFNIIDLPISIYADLFYLEFKKAKKWYNDDEKAMSDIAVAYNKSCANMQKYMVSEYAINKVIRTQKVFKSEFDETTEWKEVLVRAKLTQDWFNMLNKVEIENK